MKTMVDLGIRFLLVSTFCLFGACIAQSDPTGETASTLTAAQPAPACATAQLASASASPSSMVPGAKRSSRQPDTFPPPCGICSDFSCRTLAVGSLCNVGQCVDNDHVCSQDGLTLCRCGTAP
jgi:hypothetical protein